MISESTQRKSTSKITFYCNQMLFLMLSWRSAYYCPGVADSEFFQLSEYGNIFFCLFVHLFVCFLVRLQMNSFNLPLTSYNNKVFINL